MSARTASASTPQAAPTATSADETAATHAARIVEMKCVSMDFGANAVKILQQLRNFA